MAIKFDTPSIIKGFIYASLLAAGMFVGVFVRSLGGNFYVVWGLVSVINICATVFVFQMLKKDLKVESPKDVETASDKGSKKAE